MTQTHQYQTRQRPKGRRRHHRRSALCAMCSTTNTNTATTSTTTTTTAVVNILCKKLSITIALLAILSRLSNNNNHLLPHCVNAMATSELDLLQQSDLKRNANANANANNYNGEKGHGTNGGDDAAAKTRTTASANDRIVNVTNIVKEKTTTDTTTTTTTTTTNAKHTNTNTTNNNTTPPQHKMTATGYYTPSKFYERNGLSRPEHLDFTKLDRVIYSSFRVEEGGTISGMDAFADPLVLFGPVDWNPPENAKKYCHRSFTTNNNQVSCQTHHFEKGLIGRAHMNGCQVYPSVGGGSSSSDDAFPVMVADHVARKIFVENCQWLLTNYDFDGINIDWEFGSESSLFDTANYSILLSQLREALDDLGNQNNREYGLTAFLPCGHNHIKSIDVLFLNSVLSEFHLKTFGFHVDGKASVNSPLYDQVGNKGQSVGNCVKKYMSRGAAKEKINIALPFHGKSFNGATAIGEACTLAWNGDCSDITTWPEDNGVPQYYNIYKKLPDISSVFHEQSMTLVATTDKGIVSYDNEYSICLKTEYTIGMGLGGFVIWELAGDLLDDLSSPLLDSMYAKVNNPTLACDSEELWEATVGSRVEVHDSITEPAVSGSDTEPKPSVSEYLYVCGSGEGNARDRCNSNMREESLCPSGQSDCEIGEICFLAYCDKPDGENSNQGSTIQPPTEPSGPTFQYTCGFGGSDAQTRCNSLDWEDIPCPNGNGCPEGMLCFWTECDKPKPYVKPNPKPRPKRKPSGEFTAMATVSSTTSTTTSTVGKTSMQFRCGATRSDALTCSEDCGYNWSCPQGKDCYSVPC